jgi:multidrug resistance efflux pump
MESSHFAQRLLTILSLLALTVTGAAWWWVSNESSQSKGTTTAQVALQKPIAPEISSIPSLEVNSLPANHEEAVVETNPVVQLTGYEQGPRETTTTTDTQVKSSIPDGGVQVPPALPGASTSGGIEFKGVLAFVNDVKVVAQADGVIREFLVDEGSIVPRDKVMLEIDNRLARAEQEVAQKELESAKLKADDESQILFAEAAEKVAEADFRRTKDLYEREVANIDEFERKQLEWKKAKLSIDVSKREKKINQAAVGVSEAKLNASGVQVELRTIKAPFTGIVAKTEKENFEWVKGGDEILRLVSLEKFRVRGRVQINDSPNILERAPAKVRVQFQPGQEVEVDGVVGFVEPETSVALDGKNEYGVWVEIENRIVNGQFLFRGKMNATVRIYPNR